MSGPNARFALPPDERPPAMQPGGADHAPPPAAPAGDPGIGLQLESDAMEAAFRQLLGALNAIADQIGDARHDFDTALAARHWTAVEQALERLAGLAAHALKTARRRKPQRRQAA